MRSVAFFLLKYIYQRPGNHQSSAFALLWLPSIPYIPVFVLPISNATAVWHRELRGDGWTRGRTDRGTLH